MKKLYTVTIETEIGVIAESEEEALEAGRDALHELSSYDYDISADDMRQLPNGWDGGCLPFGDNEPERTIDQWVEAGAGEARKQSIAEWEAIRQRVRAERRATDTSGSAGEGSNG